MKRQPPPEFETLALCSKSDMKAFDVLSLSVLPLGVDCEADFKPHVTAMKRAFKLFQQHCINNDFPPMQVRKDIADIAIKRIEGHTVPTVTEGKGKALKMIYEPSDRIGLAWVQLLDAVIQEQIWRTCAHCTALFHGSNKRQRYCCDSHRAADHNTSQTQNFADALASRGVNRNLIDEVLGEIGKHR